MVKKRLPFQLALFTMLLFGAFEMLRGVSAPFMQQDWHLSYLQLGNVFIFDTLGYMTGTFCCGLVIAKLGMRWTMVFGASGMAVGSAIILFGSSYIELFPGFFFIGIGAGFLEIAANDVVPAMDPTPSGQARYFNWLHGVYGLGACLFPIIVAWLIGVYGDWRMIYGVLLVGVLVILIVAASQKRSLAIEKPVHSKEETENSASAAGLFRSPVLYALLVGISTYVMAEVTIASWLPTFLMHVKGFSLGHSSKYLSGFYLTFTIGRLTAHLWVNKVGNLWSIVMGATAAIILLAFGIFGGPGMAFCFLLAGFSFSIIFPTIAALASSMFPGRSGRVLGLLFTSASIGSFIVNWLIGAISTLVSLATGFLVVFIFLALVIVSMGVVARLTQKANKEYGAAYRVQTLDD